MNACRYHQLINGAADPQCRKCRLVASLPDIANDGLRRLQSITARDVRVWLDGEPIKPVDVNLEGPEPTPTPSHGRRITYG